MPASMGKSKFPTPTGTFAALAKEKTVVMDSRTIGIPLSDPEGYRLTVSNAVRITSGGVYVHCAPWSVGSQGYRTSATAASTSARTMPHGTSTPCG